MFRGGKTNTVARPATGLLGALLRATEAIAAASYSPQRKQATALRGNSGVDHVATSVLPLVEDGLQRVAYQEQVVGGEL